MHRLALPPRGWAGDRATASSRPHLLLLVLLVTWAGLAAAQDPPGGRKFTPQQEESIREFERLRDEGFKLYLAGRLDEAVAAVEKMLAIARDLHGDRNLLPGLRLLVVLHEKRKDPAAAE